MKASLNLLDDWIPASQTSRNNSEGIQFFFFFSIFSSVQKAHGRERYSYPAYERTLDVVKMQDRLSAKSVWRRFVMNHNSDSCLSEADTSGIQCIEDFLWRYTSLLCLYEEKNEYKYRYMRWLFSLDNNNNINRTIIIMVHFDRSEKTGDSQPSFGTLAKASAMLAEVNCWQWWNFPKLLEVNMLHQIEIRWETKEFVKSFGDTDKYIYI